MKVESNSNLLKQTKSIEYRFKKTGHLRTSRPRSEISSSSVKKNKDIVPNHYRGSQALANSPHSSVSSSLNETKDSFKIDSSEETGCPKRIVTSMFSSDRVEKALSPGKRVRWSESEDNTEMKEGQIFLEHIEASIAAVIDSKIFDSTLDSISLDELANLESTVDIFALAGEEEVPTSTIASASTKRRTALTPTSATPIMVSSYDDISINTDTATLNVTHSNTSSYSLQEANEEAA